MEREDLENRIRYVFERNRNSKYEIRVSKLNLLVLDYIKLLNEDEEVGLGESYILDHYFDIVMAVCGDRKHTIPDPIKYINTAFKKFKSNRYHCKDVDAKYNEHKVDQEILNEEDLIYTGHNESDLHFSLFETLNELYANNIKCINKTKYNILLYFAIVFGSFDYEYIPQKYRIPDRDENYINYLRYVVRDKVNRIRDEFNI